ncbi:MAG TPA: 2,3-bisphosphoglycerate-independent phosphoglycerate mutase [Candidatus Binatia bacterium]|nr:2,3-bisphosphoglycerate-independent phosphoglycerate mutase [Candidatus Binatia bacterium]
MSLPPRPFVLVVIDGWGYNPKDFGNAIAAASTPHWDQLWAAWPHTLLAASGEAVGLPDGQQGNSEVGHLTIGAGRVIFQPLTRISRAVRDGSFFENPALVGAVEAALQRGRALHLLGLVSPGGVHSHQEHALAICELARRKGLDRVCVHAFTDGRDELPNSGAGFMEEFCEALHRIGVGRVVSVAGRYYAMDRDRRWDRTARAYEIVAGCGEDRAADPVGYIRSQYRDGVTDEFLPPVAICPNGHAPARIQPGDSVVFFNFRPDRARQLTHALIDSQFDQFERSRVPTDLFYVTMTEYEHGLPVHIAYPPEEVRNSLAEVVSRSGAHQFHTAETEKYAHVTYFINGGREKPFEDEDRLLVPSRKDVPTYDRAPEMSALPVTDEVVRRVRTGDYALIVVNYANPDMVGHTGDFTATVVACETVDRCLDRVVSAAVDAGGAVLITADHGNAEHKIDPETSEPLTAHTTNPVPAVLIGTGARQLREGGGLRDVAPTVLEVMGLDRPEEMTGRSLIAG